MPRILKNIRIDEVSAVTKGAGEGTRIVLMKRDTSADDFDEWHREQARIADEQNELHLRKHARNWRSFNEVFAENVAKNFAADARGDEADMHDEETSVSETIAAGNDHHASKAADLLVDSGSHSTREEALAYLLHHKDGAALLRRLKQHQEESTMSKEELEAERIAKLRDMAKRGGAVELATAIASQGKTFGLNESDLVDLISYHDQRPGESPAQTFARNYESSAEAGLAFRKAVQVAKEAASLTPIVVDGNADNPDDAREAYEALMRLAEEQRARAPWMSTAQAFDEAFQKNSELAAKAVKPPAATTLYPFPK
jgi:hypothetical protein